MPNQGVVIERGWVSRLFLEIARKRSPGSPIFSVSREVVARVRDPRNRLPGASSIEAYRPGQRHLAGFKNPRAGATERPLGLSEVRGAVFQNRSHSSRFSQFATRRSFVQATNSCRIRRRTLLRWRPRSASRQRFDQTFWRCWPFSRLYRLDFGSIFVQDLFCCASSLSPFDLSRIEFVPNIFCLARTNNFCQTFWQMCRRSGGGKELRAGWPP